MKAYDREGQAIASLLEWSELNNDRSYAVLAQHTVGRGAGKKFLSTVWLGLDHNFTGEGPPIIFETMMFTHNRSHTIMMHRHSTEEEALAYHEMYRGKYKYSRKQRRRMKRREEKSRWKS